MKRIDLILNNNAFVFIYNYLRYFRIDLISKIYNHTILALMSIDVLIHRNSH